MKYLLSVNLLIFLLLVHPLYAQNTNKKDEASTFYLLKNDWSVAHNFDSAAYRVLQWLGEGLPSSQV